MCFGCSKEESSMQSKLLCVLIHIWTKGEVGVQWNGFKPSSKIFLLTVPRGYFFCGSMCYLCLVLVMLSRLFIAALWSPEGKGLTSWLLFVMFIMILLLSHLVSWDSCGTWLYRFLILAVFLILSTYNICFGWEIRKLFFLTTHSYLLGSCWVDLFICLAC